ncbi:thioredoxin domain-containing protein [Parvularcula sp. ZS-1/3]|uniref:Thioredoxin domain-containing protein n=1 Tax=Parvularcula mediterranea TaxID=2732508 RepID=A0A7Y3RJ51_9PROT|nr:DsbA family protein [Parvularcula mediterranea]NNU15034.1 thioredoxin domain-containing protein [Parvularcula mediterranea]
MTLRHALLSSVLLVAACGASAPTGAEAQSPSGMSDEEFDRRLREALMRNPELIIEAIEAYRTQLEEQAATASKESVVELLPNLVSAQSGHAIGASEEDASIIIVEFFDYHCGFCRTAMADVLALVEADPSVRVVFQELPILRDESRDAAAASVAAAKIDPDGYRKMHSALFQSSGVLDETAIERAAKRASLKPRALDKALEDHAEEIEATIDQSIDMARQIGIQGTPYFIVANPESGRFEILEGFRTEQFEAMVESVRGQG